MLTIWNPEQSLVPSAKFISCDVPMQLMQVCGNRGRCRVRGLMASYNGNWGFDLEDVMDVIERGIQGTELTLYLKQHPFYLALFNRCVFVVVS